MECGRCLFGFGALNFYGFWWLFWHEYVQDISLIFINSLNKKTKKINQPWCWLRLTNSTCVLNSNCVQDCLSLCLKLMNLTPEKLRITLTKEREWRLLSSTILQKVFCKVLTRWLCSRDKCICKVNVLCDPTKAVTSGSGQRFFP